MHLWSLSNKSIHRNRVSRILKCTPWLFSVNIKILFKFHLFHDVSNFERFKKALHIVYFFWSISLEYKTRHAPSFLVLTWEFDAVTETCSSPFHVSSCHNRNKQSSCSWHHIKQTPLECFTRGERWKVVVTQP